MFLSLSKQSRHGMSRQAMDLWVTAACLSLFWLIQPAAAQSREPGISPRAILIGQSASFSGATSSFTKEFRRGAHRAFNEVNSQGGVHGRQIVMIYRDDQYNPTKTRQNTQIFLERDHVFALFGYRGTATVQAALPLISKASVPLVAPLSGAQLLREPLNRLIFNVRASYHQEIEAMVNHLVRFGRDAIAIVYQKDSFGQDTLQGSLMALRRHGLKPIITVPVERNSKDGQEAARRVALSNPDAILMLTAHSSIPSLIRSLRERGSKAQIMTHSNSDAEALPPELRHGIGVSQVVPFPWSPRSELTRAYQTTMQRQKQAAHYSFPSLEGYLAAKVLVQALEKAGPIPTRAGLVKSLESMPGIDLDNHQVKFSETNHNGSDFVQLTFLMGDQGTFIH